MKEEYTRERLIKICEKSFVPQDKWFDRDTPSAQIQMSEAYVLLKAGCEFEVMYEKGGLNTDEKTIWLTIWHHDFSWIEYGGEGSRGKSETYYLPTEKRLKEVKKGDWY